MNNPFADFDNEAAAAYGVNPALLAAIGWRESGNRRDAVNRWDSNARRGTPSAGRMQFIKPTFDAYARRAREANPAAWRGVNMNWLDPRAQTLAAAWAIKNGHGNAWSTYKKAIGDVGGNTGGSMRVQESSGANPALLSLVQKKYANRPILAAALEAAISRGQAAPASNVGSGVNGIIEWARNLTGENLRPTREQTTGGHHASGSYHYAGRAVDFGDATTSRHALAKLTDYARMHPEQFKEFFYNPAGFGVKNGRLIRGLVVGGHNDHAHIAM